MDSRRMGEEEVVISSQEEEGQLYPKRHRSLDIFESLEDGNTFVLKKALLPVTIPFAKLSPSCFIYSWIRSQNPDVHTIVACFAATYMQRYLEATCLTYRKWYTRNHEFAAKPPVSEFDVHMLVSYAVCFGMAQKNVGDQEVTFSVIDLCNRLLYRFPRCEDILELEFDIMRALEFKLNPRLE